MKALGGTSFILIGFALFFLASGPMTSFANTYLNQPSEGEYSFPLWPFGMSTLPVWNGPYSQKFTVESDAPIDLALVRAPRGSSDEAVVLEDLGQVSWFTRVFPPSNKISPEIFVRFTNPTNESVWVTVTRSFGPSSFLEFVTANWFSVELISSCAVAPLLLIGARWLRRDLTLLSALRTRGGTGIFLPMPTLLLCDLVSTLIILGSGGFEQKFTTIFGLAILAGWWGFGLKFSATLALVLGYTAFTYCIVVGDDLPRWSKKAASLAFSMCVGVYSTFLPTNFMNYLSQQGLDLRNFAPLLALAPIGIGVATAAYTLHVVTRSGESK